jgi:hypothetical protein
MYCDRSVRERSDCETVSYESPVTSRTPGRAARCYTAALGCDVTQQGSEVCNVTGCYATLDKQSLSALGSDVTYTSQLHSTQRCYGDKYLNTNKSVIICKYVNTTEGGS